MEEDILGGLDPEEVFSMVTIFPKRGIKVVAHLEDKEGNKIYLKDIAQKLTTYINTQLESNENNPVNTQLFPLINQMMIQTVPRFIGLNASAMLFTSRSPRYALSTFGLQIALLIRYISQHELKIVTEEVSISKYEVEEYFRKEKEAEDKFLQAMTGKVTDDDVVN